MTWLPVDAGNGAERDAVLGLAPEPYDAVRGMLTAAWRVTDPRLLDVCRLRLAQLMETRAELDGADEHLLADLESWESGSPFDAAERAALAYAEQYHYDHNRLSEVQKQELARQLPRGGIVNFVWALHMNDAYLRVLSLLHVAPDSPSVPARPERDPTAAGSGVSDEDGDSGMAPELAAAYRKLGPVVVRQSLVDELTSEAVRLHNASHQGCLY